jgi:hypothetical protein
MIQCLYLISKVLEVIRADLPQTRRDEIHEFTEQECGYIVRIRPNKCYKDKLRCFWVYGGRLPILGAAARRAWWPRRNFQETASTDRENFS